MTTEYTPDNTRTSILAVLGLAAVVSVIAVLIGLSPKPQVDAISVSANGESPAPVIASTVNFGDDDAGTGASEAGLDEAAELEAETEDERPVIVVPTSEPTPTPAVAAVVEPTPESSDTAEAATGAVQAAPSLPSSTGTVQGSFFTKSDENEGAVVSQNVITVSFAEDGSGAFQGVLEITYSDQTRILLNMSGPLTWAPTNPQVEATLAGAFTLDAPIDADDVSSDDADLSISSLEAGSGSLCISNTKCFGFTFPQQ